MNCISNLNTLQFYTREGIFTSQACELFVDLKSNQHRVGEKREGGISNAIPDSVILFNFQLILT